MNTQLDHFENALLTEIRQYVTNRSTATRLPVKRRWALGSIVAAVAGGLAVPLLMPTPAYTVSEGNAGEIIVKVNRPEDAPGLEAKLAEYGIKADVTYLPFSQTCQPDRFTEVPDGRMKGMQLSVGENLVELVIPPGRIRDGETFVMELSDRKIPHDKYAFESKGYFAVATGPVAPCRLSSR